jgi:signal transduction histidine kinase
MRVLTCGHTVVIVREELLPPLVRRMRRLHWVVLDCVAGALLLVVSVIHAAGIRPMLGVPVWLGVALSAATAAGVAARRFRPLVTFAVVLALNTMITAAGVSGNPAVAVGLSLYTVAVSEPPRRSLAALAGSLVLTTGATAYSGLAGPSTLSWPTMETLLAGSAAIIAAAWAMGAAAREQRRHAARVAEQLAERAVTEERLRIARELHDIVAHSMTLITAKAAVTNYLIETHPDQARSALQVIETTGRTALVELRHMLGVLRAGGNAPEPPDRTPVPSLTDLQALASRATAAGVPTSLRIRGDRELPEALALTVYRIVQEALTNVVKHAGPATCRVQIDLADDYVDIDVSDDGDASSGLAGGHGLVGMRERVNLYGGKLTAGAGPEGGYRVSARIPIDGPSASSVAPPGKPSASSPASTGKPSTAPTASTGKPSTASTGKHWA